MLLRVGGGAGPSLFGVQIDGDDEPVQTQDLCENEDEDHAHEEPRLLRRPSHAGVAHDADRVARGQAREADGQAGAQVDEAPGKKRKQRLTLSAATTPVDCKSESKG